MNIAQTFQDLLHYAADLAQRQAIGPTKAFIFTQVIEKGTSDVLEDQIEVTLNSDNFLELNDIFVVQSPQSFDFSEAHSFFPAVEFSLHFLDGDGFSRRL